MFVLTFRTWCPKVFYCPAGFHEAVDWVRTHALFGTNAESIFIAVGLIPPLQEPVMEGALSFIIV